MMEYLGAVQKNTVWSWCAVNDGEKKVYFSLWVDSGAKRDGKNISYIVQEPDWGADEDTHSLSAARKDQDEKLGLVFDKGYEPWGYCIVAKDRHARPREIEETRTCFVYLLRLERLPDGTILAHPISRLNLR